MTKLQTKPPNATKTKPESRRTKKLTIPPIAIKQPITKRNSNKYNKRVAPNELFNVIIVVGIKPSSDNLSKKLSNCRTLPHTRQYFASSGLSHPQLLHFIIITFLSITLLYQNELKLFSYYTRRHVLDYTDNPSPAVSYANVHKKTRSHVSILFHQDQIHH